MNIALIAHDKKKLDIIAFCQRNMDTLKKYNLYATGTTGQKIKDATNLPVTCFQSGPIGGDQQIGAMIASNQMGMVIFFRDPLTAQPHEPDVSALMRLCDVHTIPLVTNVSSAEIAVKALEHGVF